MPIRQVPYWLSQVPGARRFSPRLRVYPRLRAPADTGVVIIGGGLTGCACAASFAAAGIKVVLLEAEAIGAEGTAREPGLIRDDFDASFLETSAAHGLRSARALWQAMHRASLDLNTALRRMKIRCDLAPADLLRFSRHDSDAAQRLLREYHARRDAGLGHTWITPRALLRETGVAGDGAIKTRGASFDPYAACVALAAVAAKRGAAIHESSEVRRIRAGRNHVEVMTAAAAVRAEVVIVATSSPLDDLRALRRHLKPAHVYSVVTQPLPVPARKEMGQRVAALRDSETPPHMLRWLNGDRILFSGADQPEVSARFRDKTLVQRTGQLMYELSTLYPAISGLQPGWAWDATRYETVDHLPFAGLHRNFPRHLFAFGGARHGAGFAWLAARILLRQHQGRPEKTDEAFGFTRVLG